MLCIDVGPVWPTNLPKTRHHSREQTQPGGAAIVVGPSSIEAERELRRVERNLMTLTRSVPMEEIEDLPPSMQPHVVGIPKAWVQLFRRLDNTVVHYSRANRPRY
jgi:hypothetical protein